MIFLTTMYMCAQSLFIPILSPFMYTLVYYHSMALICIVYFNDCFILLLNLLFNILFDFNPCLFIVFIGPLLFYFFIICVTIYEMFDELQCYNVTPSSGNYSIWVRCMKPETLQYYQHAFVFANILRPFKYATFYSDRFRHIVELTLSTLSNFISAHNRQQYRQQYAIKTILIRP